MKFNLNDNIKFRIRPAGVKVYNAHYEQYGIKPPPLHADGECPGDRLIEMQLWEFCNIFGPAMKMGFDNPVDTVIELPEGK